MAVPSNEISATDWARLAAFIDGEGCISIIRNMNKVRKSGGCQMVMAVYLGGCDPRLATWLKSTFGMGTTFVREKKKEQRPFFGWKVTGANAEALLRGCYMYLLLKKEQADVAIAFQALVRKNNGRGESIKLPSGNYEEREALKIKMERLKHIDYMEVVHA